MTATSALVTLEYDLTIPQGADWPGINYPIVGGDSTPYDLTGCSARGEIRPHPRSLELYYAWSTDPGVGEGLITLDVANHILNIRVLGSESISWMFLTGSYDLLLTNPAAPVGFRESRVAMGIVTVSPETTVLP